VYADTVIPEPGNCAILLQQERYKTMKPNEIDDYDMLDDTEHPTEQEY
jgi:hypothetical protein